jgi:type IV pilus biogenesis protein PilP
MPSARNVFEYGDRPAAVVPRAPAPATTTTPAAAPPSAPAPAAVRLVGVLRRGGALRAALAVHGEVFVLARGESAEGYTVETIDEEGVSVREPGGTIIRLSAGE